MSRSIAIGDVHGCYYTLQKLLESLQYSEEDRLYFLGDVIGKGPHSELVLDFVINSSSNMLLGNHEIAWLKHYLKPTDKPDFIKLSQHSQASAWFEYLKNRPFVIDHDDSLLVHASVDPSWDLQTIKALSSELSQSLIKDPQAFFKRLKQPASLRWHDNLVEGERHYMLLQIFTRCRYYNQDLTLNLESTVSPEESDLIPWYTLPRKLKQSCVFGHWASLGGRDLDQDYHLDGGCVYGGQLMAMDFESKERWQCERVDKDG